MVYLLQYSFFPELSTFAPNREVSFSIQPIIWKFSRRNEVKDVYFPLLRLQIGVDGPPFDEVLGDAIRFSVERT